MYVHKTIKAKPKKLYLSLMALLLMFGTTATPASVIGLQIAQAKTTKSTKKIGTKKAKSNDDKYSGLGQIRDFNAKYAEKGKPVYIKDKSNNATANLGKDVDGYLTYNGKKKFSPSSVKYFGGAGGHWYKKGNSIRFVKNKKNYATGAGSTGVVYPGIAVYHNVHNRKLDTKAITVRVTWMGGPKKDIYSDTKNVGQKQLAFHTNEVSVSAQGENSTDSFKVEYFTNTSCTTPLVINSAGTPVTKNVSGAVTPQTAFTFKDIDNGQYLDLQKAKTKGKYTKAFYDNGNEKKGQKTKVRPYNGSEYAKKGNLWTGGVLGDKGRHKAKPGEVDSGSIDTNDPRGFITFIADDNHMYDFGHGSSSTAKSNVTTKVSFGTLKSQSGLKPLPKSKDYLPTFGNKWAFGSNGNQNLRWKGTATKYVSDKGISGATPGSDGKIGSPGKHESSWVKNLVVNGTDKPIYYGIVTSAAWPANYHKGDKILGINNFGLADNHISPGLTINYVKVYSQTALGKNYYDKTYMFDTSFSNETHEAKAVLKDKYAGNDNKSSVFFGHRWTVVIKATPNKDLPANQPIHAENGDTKLGAVIDNTAQWVGPTTRTGTDVFHGSSIGGSTVQITQTKPQYNKNPETGTAHKYVFRHGAGSANKNTWADNLDQNYDGGTVYPGQELKYQIRVHMPRIGSDSHFENIHVVDDPKDNITLTSSKSSSPSASSGDTVKFDVTAKVNDDTKTGDEATNTGHIDYTIVTRRYRTVHKGDDAVTHKPIYGEEAYDDYDNRSMSVNTTHNKVITPNVKAPIKTAYAVEDGKLYPLNQLEYNKKFKYVISQEVGTRNVDTAGNSFELKDNLPNDFKADGLTARVYRLSNDLTNKAAAGDKKIGAAKALAIDDDDTKYGVDVTNTEGSLKTSGNNFTWVGDTDKMPFKGETYTMVITGIYKSGGSKLPDSDTNGGNDYAVTNTATTKIDNTSKDSNKVVVPVEMMQPSLDKSIVGIHDDTTNQDITDFTQILKPQDDYTITYNFTSFAGSEFDGKSYVLKDDLPDNMTISSIGKPKGSIMTSGGDGVFQDDDSVVANVSTSGTGTNHLEVTNKKVKGYGQISIDVKAKVKGQGDWSNYYDRMVYNNGNEGSADNKATDSSYMRIPNEANETYENSDSVDAHNSSGIDFNMGVQTLKVKQYIAQDDSKWTDDLKSSHYLPVSDGKADNSNKAVTTMLVIYAPNYLKNQKVDITSQSDNSKVDGSSFDSGGFERGGSAFNLMDNNKAIAYKNDASKLDFDNLNLSPSVVDANKTTSNTVYSTDLKTPGQTYTYEQKYSPTTKFAKKFAKLDHMHNTFSSKVKFSDSTENNNDYFKGINNVGIKLSNIYGYTTRMSKGTYSQNGKTVDVKLYGEQVGLAVDNNNKTNFTEDTDKFTLPNTIGSTRLSAFDTASSATNYTDKDKSLRIGGYDESAEKQPVAVWISPYYESCLPQASGEYAKSNYGYLQTLRLKSNVGQDEKVKIGTNPDTDNTEFKNIPAESFWHYNIISRIGFASGSARTMTKGHSVVVATTDPQAKNKEDTLAANRVSSLSYEKYVQHILSSKDTLTSSKRRSDTQYKTSIDTDFVDPNTVATNPAQFITYYNSNALPEKDIKDAKPAAQRTLREAYWFTAPKSMSAKASYGLELPYQLHSFTFGKIPSDDTLQSMYQTNLQSKDAIFDAGNTKTANDERLGYSYDATQDPDKIAKTLDDNGLANKTELKKLLDAIDPKSNPVVADDDKWLNILPEYNLVNLSFRFNNRVLDKGKQSFAKDNVMYDSYNKNMFGYTYGDDLVKGGFRNYLRDDLELTKYPLNMYSSTSNRGLIDFPGFGVGYATSFDFTQNLDIYGTRMATKNDHDSKDSDIIVEPALSGRSAQKHDDLGDKGNEWLKHNDAGTLFNNSSSSKILNR